MRVLLSALPSITLGLSPTPAPVAPAQSPPAVSVLAPALTLSLSPAYVSTLTPALSARTPVAALPALRSVAARPLNLDNSVPSEALRAASSVLFDESPTRAKLSLPAVETGGERGPRHLLAPLGFEDLTPPNADEPPSTRSPERKPFLLRHYRTVRFFAAPLLRLIYTVRVSGFSHIPSGPALIIPNHVSLMDPLLLSFATNRPMRFLMYRGIYETYGLQWLFRSLGTIPISPKDPKDVIEDSLYRARRALASGETVVVFPEGQLTRDGDFNPFRRGFERVAAGTGAPVIPAHIDGMWGSAFSRHPDSSFLRGMLRLFFGRRRVSVRFGPPLPRADTTLARDAVGLLAASPDSK